MRETRATGGGQGRRKLHEGETVERGENNQPAPDGARPLPVSISWSTRVHSFSLSLLLMLRGWGGDEVEDKALKSLVAHCKREGGDRGVYERKKWGGGGRERGGERERTRVGVHSSCPSGVAFEERRER
jgi:hypothetical protein